MILGGVTLPESAWVDPPALAAEAAVTVEHDIAGRAVIWAQPLTAGTVIGLHAPMATHDTAAALAALVGTRQVLQLDDGSTVAVVCESMDARPVMELREYADGDYVDVDMTLRRV